MLYNCGCGERVIEVDTRTFFEKSEKWLEQMCVDGPGAQINSTWYDSHLGRKGVIQTKEERELEEEQEYENEDETHPVELNIDNDYWD